MTILWCAVFAGLALLVLSGRGIARGRILYAGGGVVAAMAAASALSQNRVVSLLGLYHRYGGLLPAVLYVALALLVAALYAHRPSLLREVVWASAAASTLVSIHVLAQRAGIDWVAWREPSGARPRFPLGTLGNSEFTGAYLGIAVVMLWALRGGRLRVPVAAGAAVHGAAIWATQSRSGMLAALAGWFTIAILERRRIPRVVLGATTIGIVAVVALAVWRPGRAEVFRSESLEHRAWSWSAAWRMSLDHPVVGTGPDTFFENYPPYRLPQDARELGLIVTDKPHNVFLERLATTGVAGLGSYLILVGLALASARRAPAAAAGLVAYLAQGVFSIDVPPLAFTGWLALGMSAAHDAGKEARLPRPFAALAVPLLLAGLLPLAADIRARTAQRADSAEGYVRAARLNPIEPDYWFQAAAKTRSPAVAVRHSLRAWRMQPGNLHFILGVARSYEAAGRPAEAARWLAKAAAHDPNNPRLP